MGVNASTESSEFNGQALNTNNNVIVRRNSINGSALLLTRVSDDQSLSASTASAIQQRQQSHNAHSSSHHHSSNAQGGGIRSGGTSHHMEGGSSHNPHHSHLNTTKISAYNNENDPLTSHIARDLPHHILERKLGPSSGRMMSTYRIRHVDTGAVLVLKAMLVNVQVITSTSTSTSTNTSVVQTVVAASGNTKSNNNSSSSNHATSSDSASITSNPDNDSPSLGSSRSDSSRNDTQKEEEEDTNLTSSQSNDDSIVATTPTTFSREHGTMTQDELVKLEKELNCTLQLLSSTPSSDKNSTDATCKITHSNMLPYHSWFVSSYGTPLSTTTQTSTTNPSSSGTTKMMTTQSQKDHTTSSTQPPLPPRSTSTNTSNVTITTTTTISTIQKPVYLLRPHTYTTLSRRIQTRPFLSLAEKTFIAYSILRSLDSLHNTKTTKSGGGGVGLCHGNLTCGNIGLSSWNWVVFLDLLPLASGGRPIVVPDDDPSDWIYYFQERSSDLGSGGGGTGSSTGSGVNDGNAFIAGNVSGGGGEGGSPTGDSNNIFGLNTTATTGGGGGGGNSGGIEKRCYLAPERFISKEQIKTSTTKSSSTSKIPNKLTPAMDIFSLGCVLMELFLNGEPAMDIGDLMEYRRLGGNIAQHSSLPQKLNRIESSSMRAACRHMLHLDPNKRLSAGEYLKRLMAPGLPRPISGSTSVKLPKTTTPVVPLCHETVFFPFLERVRCEVLSPDARIALAAIQYGNVLRSTVGVEDTWGETYFRKIISTTIWNLEQNIGEEEESKNSSPNEKDDQVTNSSFRVIADENNPGCSIIKFPSSSLFPFSNPFNSESDAFDDKHSDTLLAETELLLRQLEMSNIYSDDFGSEFGMSNNNPEEKKEATKNEMPTTKKVKAENQVEMNKGTPSSSQSQGQVPSPGALIIFVQFILATIRHTQRPSSRLVALQLLLRLARFSSDEVRLQRIVPTIVSVLHDTDPSVRAMSIRVLTAVLGMIENFPPSDAQVFPQYILKRVAHLILDPILIVRVAFAESIASLSETALRFLDTCHAIKLYETVDGEGGTSSDEEDASSKVIKKAMASVESAFDDNIADLLGGSTKEPEKKKPAKKVTKEEKKKKIHDPYIAPATTLIRNDYDKELLNLHETVAQWVVSITTDTSDHSSALKHALLKDIARLCNFFGQDGVMACILPQVLAFLNHRKDWQLRASLCQHLPSICTMVGRAATEQFVVPCVETALIDEEDLVISSAVTCLASLVKMGLLTRASLLGMATKSKLRPNNQTRENASEGRNVGIIEKYSALLVYPCNDVRQATILFVASCCQYIGFPDDEAFISPLIRPFLRYDIPGTYLRTVDGIRSCLIPPLTQNELDLEVNKPQWTAIGVGNQQTGQEVVPEETSYLLDHVRPYHSNELMTRYIEALEIYLRLLRRNIKNNYFMGDFDKQLRVINHGIRGINRAAFSCYLPNQKYAEFFTKMLPVWYDQMRHITSLDPTLESEVSSLRTLTSLSKVFGLTIVQPTNSAEPHRRWKGEVLFDALSDSSFPIDKDGRIEEKALMTYLQSPESRAFCSATHGEWAALSIMDPAYAEMSMHVSKIVSLGIPPIPPRMGVLRDESGRSYSCHGMLASSRDTSDDKSTRAEWRPKADALVCTSPPYEHNGPVTKLAVSQDQSFFVSASHDGTCKVWETRQVEDSSGDLQSCLTYDGQNVSKSRETSVKINDISIIENSHSVASGGSDGSVHVWRVDTLPKESGSASNTDKALKTPSVTGCSLLRKVEPDEGEILSVSHFNTAGESVIAFATQRGFIHSWDLRCMNEPFSLSLRPELGYLTSMAVGNDRNWIVAGSDRGFLALWDIRFQKMVKLWQHSSASPVNKLATSFAALENQSDPKPFVVMGCGQNEVSVFDISKSSCHKCFRVLDPALSYVDHASLPIEYTTMPNLTNVPITSEFKRRISGISDAVSNLTQGKLYPPEPSIHAMTGRVGTSGHNYLATGGSDGFIRYWDFSSHSKCYTISGLTATQPRPSFEKVYNRNSDMGDLVLCRQQVSPKLKETTSDNVPKKLQCGSVRPETCHTDAILDLKKIEAPMKGLLSCSRDGVIKLWR